MQHGSLQNLLAAKSNSREGGAHLKQWEVGEGMTLIQWTDRHAYTVIDVQGEGEKQVVTIQRDIATAQGEMARDGYTYERDPKGATEVVRFGDAGWRTVKRSTGRYGKKAGYAVKPGRDEHYDYSF